MVAILRSKLYFLEFICLLSVSSIYCQPKTITILHTNDMHASFIPHEAGWVRSNPKPQVGGFLELGWMIDSIRKSKGDVLILDGGDVMTGNPIAEYEYRSATGGALFEMMNTIGYNAWTIGNHDLDISQENLSKLTSIAQFTTLSANLTDSLGKFPFNNKEYVILKKNGLRIGIIGIMSNDLFQLTNTNNLIGLKVLPAADVMQRIIDKINSETDVIVALTHEGVDDDSLLATKVHGLDLIVGAHSHTRLKVPEYVNGVIIVQTGSYCENLGELELNVDNHKISSYKETLHTLWVQRSYPKNELSKLVSDFKTKIDKEYGEVLGTLTEDYKRSRSGESKIGHFLTNAILEGTSADLAITNSSGIRKDLAKGNITKLDLFEVSPFRNYLCTFPISGKELRNLVQRYVQSLIEGRTSLDFSGVQCKWKLINGNPNIELLTINGKGIINDRQYTCGTIDYVINQGDHYLGMQPSNVVFSKVLFFQALVNKVKRDKTIQESNENRFQEIK